MTTTTSPLHTGWLQYHIHIPSLAYPFPDLDLLDSSSLPQYYFTLHPEQLDCSLNPTSALDAPPLSSILLSASTTIKLLGSPLLTAINPTAASVAAERLHYVFCLSDSDMDGSKRVHVLSAARRSDMEQWLTALRRCLFNIRQANATQPLRTTFSLPAPPTTTRPRTAPNSTQVITFQSSPIPLPASALLLPHSPSLSSSSSSSLRQRLLQPADMSSVSVVSDVDWRDRSGAGGSGDDDGMDRVYSERLSWSEQHHHRKLCCIIC